MALDRVSPPPPAVQSDPRDVELAELRRLLAEAREERDRLLVHYNAQGNELQAAHKRNRELERKVRAERRRATEGIERAGARGRQTADKTLRSGRKVWEHRRQGKTWLYVCHKERLSESTARWRMNAYERWLSEHPEEAEG
jgi:hypothetical protein